MRPNLILDDEVELFAWNPHVGNPWVRVRAVLNLQERRRRPDIIALNEVKKHWVELRRWAAEHDYEIWQEIPREDKPGKPVHEEGSTCVMVTRRRRDLEIITVRLKVMRRWWKVFSHNRWHYPRRYWLVKLRTRSGRSKWLISHWPTNGFKGGNARAFVESATRSRTTLTMRLPGTMAGDVGDHNEDVPTLRAWARKFGALVVGHGPDSLFGVGMDLTAEVLPKWHSDHHAMRYIARRNRRRTK